MNSKDNLFVARCYRSDATRASMLEAFHRAVAKKLGDARVRDVFSVDEFMALYRSIAGADMPLAMVA
jgi:hypothetical protein